MGELILFPGVRESDPGVQDNAIDPNDDLVHIRWTDSGLFHENGWESAEDIIPVTSLATVDTVGIMFHEDEQSYRVALSVDREHGHYFGVQTIAKNCVVSMRNV